MIEVEAELAPGRYEVVAVGGSASDGTPGETRRRMVQIAARSLVTIRGGDRGGVVRVTSLETGAVVIAVRAPKVRTVRGGPGGGSGRHGACVTASSGGIAGGAGQGAL